MPETDAARIRRIYDEGRGAFRDGDAAAACPYPADPASPEAHWWNAGFEGERMRRERERVLSLAGSWRCPHEGCAFSRTPVEMIAAPGEVRCPTHAEEVVPIGALTSRATVAAERVVQQRVNEAEAAARADAIRMAQEAYEMGLAGGIRPGPPVPSEAIRWGFQQGRLLRQVREQAASEQQIRQAYAEGRLAARSANGPPGRCPYPAESVKAYFWSEGMAAATVEVSVSRLRQEIRAADRVVAALTHERDEARAGRLRRFTPAEIERAYRVRSASVERLINERDAACGALAAERSAVDAIAWQVCEHGRPPECRCGACAVNTMLLRIRQARQPVDPAALNAGSPSPVPQSGVLASDAPALLDEAVRALSRDAVLAARERALGAALAEANRRLAEAGMQPVRAAVPAVLPPDGANQASAAARPDATPNLVARPYDPASLPEEQRAAIRRNLDRVYDGSR